MKPRTDKPAFIERIVTWIGSLSSLAAHTIMFVLFFASVWFGLLTLNSMLLILTTVVSLEAIYLAIFIQMTVNKNTASLREVEENIDEIQEDVEELGEDVEGIQEDIEEITEDMDEIHADDEKDVKIEEDQKAAIDQLTADVRKVLADLEALKKTK